MTSDNLVQGVQLALLLLVVFTLALVAGSTQLCMMAAFMASTEACLSLFVLSPLYCPAPIETKPNAFDQGLHCRTGIYPGQSSICAIFWERAWAITTRAASLKKVLIYATFFRLGSSRHRCCARFPAKQAASVEVRGRLLVAQHKADHDDRRYCVVVCSSFAWPRACSHNIWAL